MCMKKVELIKETLTSLTNLLNCFIIYKLSKDIYLVLFLHKYE